MSPQWGDLSDGQKASFPTPPIDREAWGWGGGVIPGPGKPIFVRPVQPKQPGDIDEEIIYFDGRPLVMIRWNADGSMSYRD